MAEAWIRITGEIPDEILDRIVAKLIARSRQLADQGICACPVCGTWKHGHGRSALNIRLADIIASIAEAFDLPVRDLTGARRDKVRTLPRQIAMWLCEDITGRSSSEIGRAFGDRDRTTVLHAVRKIRKQMAADIAFAATVERLRLRIIGPVEEAAE